MDFPEKNTLPTKVEKSELVKEEQQLVRKRRKPYEIYLEKKNSDLVKYIEAQLNNVPNFFEQLSQSKEIALDISKELAEQIANGEIEFAKYTDTGQRYAQFKNTETKKLFSNIPIKEMEANLGSSIAMAGLTNQLQEINRMLILLNNKIGEVSRSLDLDRYAEVQAAKEKFEMAMLTRDPDIKKTLFLESLNQAINAKNLLLNQLFENKNHLIENGFKAINIPIVAPGMSAAEADEKTQSALQNLSYMKDAFSFQIAVLFELKEFEALKNTLIEFEDLIINNFSEDEALMLDGFIKDSGNPFIHLSKEVINSTDSMVKYIENNDDIIEMHLIPEIFRKVEEKNYENE